MGVEEILENENKNTFEKFYQPILKKKEFKENHFYICQEITFPFEVDSRQIKCFNKEEKIKKKKKKKRKN
jgi:hypothetical protein